MGSSINSVTLVGNLTKDPELRHLPSGTPVCELRLAVNDRVKREGEWTDVAYFFDVKCWGRQGEAVAEHMRKGRQVGVQGRLTWREWESEGGKRQRVEIVADTVMFLRDGSGSASSRRDDDFDPHAHERSDFEPPASDPDSDIPF
jgi:single-strand DNA-binding protein